MTHPAKLPASLEWRHAQSLPPARPSALGSGSIVGYANDSSDRRGIGGLVVQLYSPAPCGGPCPIATTNVSGWFDLPCPWTDLPPPGLVQIAFVQNNWYMDDFVNVTCVAGRTVDVGTVLLVRDGVASGVVRNDLTGQPVVGVQVVAISRDLGEVAFPSAKSGTNGAFQVALPAVPSVIEYFAPVGYESTFNFTNATPGAGSRPLVPPWSGGVQLGTVGLVPQTLVVAHLLDAETGKSLGAQTPVEMTPCDSLTGGCDSEGSLQAGNEVRTWASPGPDIFQVLALGYVAAWTLPRTIPRDSSASAFDLGNVSLLPLGAFYLDSAISRPLGGPVPNVLAYPLLVSVQDCTLNNYPFTVFISQFNLSSTQCITIDGSVGPHFEIPAAPLRNYVAANVSLANYPAWPNATFVNVTAGHRIAGPDPVWLNFTVGDYVAGRIHRAGSAYPPSWFVVQEVSTDSNGWGIESYTFPVPGSTPQQSYFPCESLAPYRNDSFCIAVPPGDAQLFVNATGYAENRSWVHTPDGCCRANASKGEGWPMTLAAATSPSIDVLNLTPNAGGITGTIDQRDAPAHTVPWATAGVCPGESQSSSLPCWFGPVVNGSLAAFPVVAGIDAIQVQAGAYAPTTVWANVSVGRTTAVGEIPLAPMGVISGRVVSANRSPVYHADVYACRITAPQACEGAGGGPPLGIGETGSDGRYEGPVPGGPVPVGTYVVDAVAPGDLSDWAIVNVTAGNVTVAPTLTLPSIGSNGTLRSPAPTSGVWVYGRVIANGSGGVVVGPGGLGQGIGLCDLSTGTCGGIDLGTNADGWFNGSVAPGLYDLNVSASGFAPVTLFVNATLAGVIDIGTVVLTQDPWLSGQLVIAPWTSVTESSGGLYGSGYGPSVVVQACTLDQSRCDPALPTPTNGSFRVPRPPLNQTEFLAEPAGGGAPGSPSGGYVGVRTAYYELGTGDARLASSGSGVPVPILAFLSGQVLDGGNRNGSGPLFGAPFASVTCVERGNFTANQGALVSSVGAWGVFLPGGNGPNMTTVEVSDPPAYDQGSYSVTAALTAGNSSSEGGNATLNRFGWVQVRFASSLPAVPLTAIRAVATVFDPSSGFWYSNGDISDSGGFLNITAPRGDNVTLRYGGPEFNGSLVVIPQVVGSTTTVMGPNGTGNPTPYLVDPIGVLVSSPTNDSSVGVGNATGYPSPVVRDAMLGVGVAGVLVTVTNPDTTVASGGSTAPTNLDGQFVTDAPVGPTNTWSFSVPGYLENRTSLPVAIGEYRRIPEVNLTPEAVVTGIVRAQPGGAPVPGAQVLVCGSIVFTAECGTGVTNLSGEFGIVTWPGTDTVTVTAGGFLGNSTTVNACAGCFASSGVIELPAFGWVSGAVRAVPSGLPLRGADVSLCAPTPAPAGPCGWNASTDRTGTFVISAAPGAYALTIVLPGFNTSYLELAIAAGERVHVGTLDLTEDGTLQGVVVDATTGAGVPGATVDACPDFSGVACTDSVSTDLRGDYTLRGAPGPYAVTASDAGYRDGGADATIRPAAATSVGRISLDPIGPDSGVTFVGVVDAAGTGRPIGNATVSAIPPGASGAAGSTSSSSNGSFTLAVPYGPYELRAWADGYRASQISVGASGTYPSFRFELEPTTYPISGFVLDAVTSVGIPGAGIWSVGTGTAPVPLGTSTPNGSFLIQLPNSSASSGAFELDAIPPVSNPLGYIPASFALTVNGRGFVRNLTMSPGRSELHLEVIDAATGLGISGASAAVGGLVEGMVPTRTVLTTDPSGNAGTTLYRGSYSVEVHRSGFAPRLVAFTTGPSGPTNLTVALTPSANLASASALPLSPPELGLIAAAGLATGVVVVWLGPALRTARHRPPLSGARSGAELRSEVGTEEG